MDRVTIEVEQPTNTWMVVRYVTPYSSQGLVNEMKQVKQSFPNARVRAVDKDGRLVDML